jgi:hypothetical protein
MCENNLFQFIWFLFFGFEMSFYFLSELLLAHTIKYVGLSEIAPKEIDIF